MIENSRTLKAHIDELKDSIKIIFTEIKKLNQSYDYLKGDMEAPLNLEYIRRVEEYQNLN